MSDEWVLIGLDEKMARRNGVPPKIPVPKSEFEGLAESGLPPDRVRTWITSFVAKHSSGLRTQDPQLAARFDAFLGKAEHWKRAHDAFEKGDPAKAIAALRLVCAVDPNDHAARLNMASALAGSGDPKKALEHLEAIRATFEGDPDYHVTVGQVRLALQDRDGAVGEMVLALEAKPDHQSALDVLRQLGVLVAVYEDPRDAASLTYVRADAVVDWIPTVWDAAPRDVAYWLEQVAYHELERRPSVVLAAAERGLAANADEKANERLSLARIAALRALGRVEESLVAARAFAESHPSSAAPRVELSKALSASGQAEAARAALDEALAIDPGDLEALDMRFWPEERGDLRILADALPALEKHANAHEGSPGAWRSLARMKLAIGSSDEALSLFERAAELAPNDDALVSELWVELVKARRAERVLELAQKIPDLAARDWRLRWSEAEAWAALGKKTEAYAAYAAINADEKLLVDVRRRAKRAAEQVKG